MFFLILILLLGYIILGWLISGRFESIANEKGHYGYFWWCFWLGIIGCLMVVALPDRNEKCNVENTNNTNCKKSTNTSANSGGFSLHAMALKRETHQKNMTGKWSCKNCGTLNNNIDIQCKDCGKYR